MPRSPTMVSKPRGNSRISVRMCAMAAESSICWSVALGVPKEMLWRMVSEKRKVSWGTKPMLARSSDSGKERMGHAVDEDHAGVSVLRGGR